MIHSINNSDVNHTDMFNYESRLLIIDAETRHSFSEKKTIPNRAKRVRAELRLLQNITDPK